MRGFEVRRTSGRHSFRGFWAACPIATPFSAPFETTKSHFRFQKSKGSIVCSSPLQTPYATMLRLSALETAKRQSRA